MTEDKNNNEVKTVTSMMIIMLLGKVLGLYRDMKFASTFGASSVGDAFTFASTIPRNFLDIIFASAISASFIPIFNEYLSLKSKKEAYSFANNFVSIITFFSVIITAVAIIFATQIVDIGVAGYSYETKVLTVKLLRIMLPIIISSAIAFSLVGIVQSLGEFNIPAAMSIVSNIIILFYYFFFIDKYGVFGLAVAFVIGWTAQVFIQLPFLKRNGFRFVRHINFKDEGIRKTGKLMLPVMISTWVQPINFQINISATSKMPGWGTAFNTANVLYSIITGIFILSAANVIFPKLSKINATQGNDHEFAETLKLTLRGLLYILLPIMVGLMILTEPTIKLFFERNNFDSTATKLTSTALFYFCLGIPGYCFQTILSRGFYSTKQGKLPLITGIITVFINASLSFLLIDKMGIKGPALASSIAITVSASIMYIFMFRKYRNIFDFKFLKHITYMLISAMIMGIIVYFSKNFIKQTFSESLFENFLELIVPIAIGVISYLVSTFILKVDEIIYVKNTIITKLKK